MDSQSQNDAFVPRFKPFLICNRIPEILTTEEFNRIHWNIPCRWAALHNQNAVDQAPDDDLPDLITYVDYI